MFYLKRIKPIKLRFYTDNANAYELFKPSKASNFSPDWRSNKEDQARHCYGLKSMFQDGFIIPLWSDLMITTTNSGDGEVSGSFEFSDKKSLIELQTAETSAIPKNKICFKILSPWLCECDEDIKFIKTENMWSNPDRGAEFLSGVLDFKYQNSTNMFFYIDKKEQTLLLKANDTPVLFRQLSERRIDIECLHDPDKFEYLQDKISRPFFEQRHIKKINLLRKKHGHT